MFSHYYSLIPWVKFSKKGLAVFNIKILYCMHFNKVVKSVYFCVKRKILVLNELDDFNKAKFPAGNQYGPDHHLANEFILE